MENTTTKTQNYEEKEITKTKKAAAAENNIEKTPEPISVTTADEDWEIAQEHQAVSMFERYRLNPKLGKMAIKAKTTKVLIFKNEDIVLRTSFGAIKKDIRLSPNDKEFLLFRGIGKEYDGIIGQYIGNKSQKPYHGVRFDLGNGQFINYAFTINDFRMLVEMDWARENVGA